MNVKANYQKRTFTITTESNKYRTSKFSKDEFEDMDNNTPSDWKIFLSHSNSYFLVK
jgi:hypothetical protein